MESKSTSISNLPFVILVCLFLPNMCLSSNDGDLKAALFASYDPQALPSDEMIEVKLAFALNGVVEVNTVESYVVLAGYIKQYWHDERLIWNPEDYGGIKKIRVNSDPEAGMYLWTPDISIYERDNQDSTYSLSQIESDGNVYWSRLNNFRMNLNFDLNSYPFDTQYITMTLESWSYTADILYIKSHSVDPVYVNTQAFVQNVEWNVLELKNEDFYMEYDTGEYTRVIFTYIIQRQGTTIEKTVIYPAFLVAFLAFLYYLLPIGTGERTNFLATLMLTIIMFLVMLTTFVPVSKSTSGIIDIFFTLTIIMFIVIIIVLIMDWLHNKINRDHHPGVEMGNEAKDTIDNTQRRMFAEESKDDIDTSNKAVSPKLVPDIARNKNEEREKAQREKKKKCCTSFCKKLFTPKRLTFLDKIIALISLVSFLIFSITGLASLYKTS